MSVLGNRLTASAGLGGVTGGGPPQNFNLPLPTFGNSMGSQSTGSGILGDFKNASSDVQSGKISLAVLESLVILMVLWYLWTHAIQGGG